MQSKTSFFNKTLYCKLLKRSWPLWALVTIGGCMIPLMVVVSYLGNVRMRLDFTTLTVAQDYYEILASGVPVISLIYGVICAASVWQYLYTQRSIGFFHSLPVKREGLFLTHYLAGYSMMIIPYIVSGLLMTIVTICFGAFNGKATLILVLGVLGESLIFYSLATLVAHVVGNPMALPIVYLIGNFASVGAEYLFTFVAERYIYGLGGRFNARTSFLSPIWQLYSKISVYYDREEIYDSVRDVVYWELRNVTIQNTKTILIYSMLSLFIIALSYVAYRFRRSEAAGEVIVFKWIKQVVQILATVVAALLGGLILDEIVSVNQSGYSAVRTTVCVIIAGVLSYYIAKMILNKTIKVFDKKSYIECGICTAAYIVFFAALSFDVFGVGKFVPKMEDVNAVDIRIGANSFYFETATDPEMVEGIINLHEKIVENKELLLDSVNNFYGGNYFYDNGGMYSTEVVSGVTEAAFNQKSYYYYEDIHLTYYLDGKSVSRFYQIRMNEAVYESTFGKEYNEFASQPRLALILLHVYDEYEPVNAYVDYYVANDNDFYQRFEDKETVDILHEALVTDAKMGYYKPVYDADYRYSDEEKTVYVEFQYDTQEMVAGNMTYSNSSWVNVNVRAGMVNTINALTQLNIISEDYFD